MRTLIRYISRRFDAGLGGPSFAAMAALFLVETLKTVGVFPHQGRSPIALGALLRRAAVVLDATDARHWLPRKPRVERNIDFRTWKGCGSGLMTCDRCQSACGRDSPEDLKIRCKGGCFTRSVGMALNENIHASGNCSRLRYDWVGSVPKSRLHQVSDGDLVTKRFLQDFVQ